MCMQEIAAGQDVSGGVGSEKLKSVFGNYVSPQKILKQLKESPDSVFAMIRYSNPFFIRKIIRNGYQDFSLV